MKIEYIREQIIAYKGAFRQEQQLSDNMKWNKALEYVYYLLVPVPERSLLLGTRISEPVCNKSTNGVKELPK